MATKQEVNARSKAMLPAKASNRTAAEIILCISATLFIALLIAFFTTVNSTPFAAAGLIMLGAPVVGIAILILSIISTVLITHEKKHRQPVHALSLLMIIIGGLLILTPLIVFINFS